MKKKIAVIILIIIAIAIGGGLIWYNTAVAFVGLNAADVLEIVIFNGNTGETLHISDKNNIEHILSNWNAVTLKRDKISINYSGFSFRTTIYLNDGEQADGWNNFIINSNDTVRKDPFFYKTTDTLIDYKYIETLFDENIE